MASIKSISVRDLTGLANIGGAGETATVVLTLDEAVTVTNGTINFASVTPTFQVGATVINPSNISFVGYNPSAKTISYNVVIPSNQALSGALSLTSISLNNITITGKKGALSPTVSLTSNYIIDNTMPVFSSFNTTNTIDENTSPARTPLFTATATDSGSGIASYRLTGTDASLFNVDARGVVRFKVAPNFETKSQYGLNVVAVDRAGNSNAQALTVNLNNVDEAVTLARGVTGVGNITLSSGNLANQGRSILADFSNNSTNSSQLTFTSGTVKGITNFSVANGILSGTATAGTYKFTAQSADGSTTNGRDASRSYNLVIVDKPSVTGIQVSDSDNTGRAGNVVTIKVILSEAINPLTGTPNITANFTAGRNTFTGSFSNVSTENGVSVLNFNAALPAGDSNSISLTTLSLGSTTLTGVLTAGTTTSTQSRINQSTTYLLDNTAPRITSPASINVNENAQGVIYTATATDLNTVRYSITGSEASLFSMDANTGRLSVVGSLDYEALKSSNYRVSLTVTATDSNGNFSARPIVVNVRDVNEASVLSKGQATLTDFNLYKIIDATSYITPINADVADPEGRPLTYRISDGWLPAGLTLNTKTGAVTGKPTGNDGAAYNFTITADDGVLNGTDASRSYSGSITSKIALTATDTLLNAADTNTTLTVKGVFAVGGTMQVVRVGTGGNADTPVGSVTTLGQTNTESVQLIVSKSALISTNTGNADFYVSYLSGDIEQESVRLNITRDDVAPTISAVSLSSAGVSNSIVNAWDVVTASVTYAEAVQVTGVPSISLVIGTNTKTAIYSNTNGSVVNFIYTIQSGDNDTNGISVPANSINVSAASTRISDIVGNTSANTFSALNDVAGMKVDTRVALGFVINGQGGSDYSGAYISSAGDVNGDGLGDLIVGAYQSDPSAGSNAGRSYVVWGRPNATAINLATVANGTGGFVINGQCTGDLSGISVSYAGDVNGDGWDDLIVGASNSDSNAGRSYVVWGKTSGGAIDLSNVAAGTGGFVINGQGAGDYSGYSVSTAGDVNGDGLADLIVGAYASDPSTGTNAGRSYVLWGKTSATAIALTAVDSLTSTLGFVINGQGAGDYSGYSVSAAGDVNGDGLADLIVGAYLSDPNQGTVNERTNAGRSYVVWGKPSNDVIDLTNVALGTGGFVINGHSAFGQSGYSVSSAGDVNGDGLADLIIGANIVNRSYVVWGKPSGAAIELANVESGIGGFVITGQALGDFNGYSVSSAGDINGDGLIDLIVGAPFSDPSARNDAGRSYVVWGKTSSGSISLANVAAGTGGFLINGQCAGDQSGFFVSPAGDVNGDGLADLIIGAPYSDPTAGTDAGRTYVIFGKTDTTAINLSDVPAGNGAIVNYANTPTSGNDTFNGTTASEIILGAAGNDTLAGGGGTDVLLGGMGDDVLILNASNISALSSGPILVPGENYFQLARVDGGTGIDTLRVTDGANLDLTIISQIAASNPKVGSRISSIERIDLATDTAANTLKLNLYDVLDMTGMNLFNSGNGWTGLTAQVARHQLVINGGAGDSVDIADGTGTANWTSGATVTNGGVSYVIWNHNTAAAQLLVQQGVGVI